MSRGTTENFEVQNLENVTPKLSALMKLERLAISLKNHNNPISEMEPQTVEWFVKILDPDNWIGFFPPSALEAYRDSSGRPLRGQNYEERVETMFRRFINPVGLAFGEFVAGRNCEELCGDGPWAKMYCVLTKWNACKVYFLYVCDPFDLVIGR